MENFYKNISENTIPLLIYLVASFISIFVTNINFLGILLLLYICISAVLFNSKILLKILFISLCVIPIIVLLSMFFAWDISYQQFILSLPKSISFSIMISSAIAFFLFLPTYQLFSISKTIIRSNYPAYALLAGFRTFPVFFQFSKKIFVAIKIRKAYSSYLDFVLLYVQNIFIEFLIFLDDFIVRFSYLNLHKIQTISIFNYKSYLAIIYLIISISFVIFG